jgi:hypothetical protein
MDRHMEYLVLNQGRNFSVLDFRRFEVDGKEYRMSSGRFRNKISKRRKAGLVELDCRSSIAIYTLKGHRFGKPMTHDHEGAGPLFAAGRKTPIYKWIKNISVDKQSLHDIRLTFEANGIWTIFSAMYPEFINQANKDINLPTWTFVEDIDVKVTIHHTDTVSVALACSYRAIAIDVNDVPKLFEVLTRTEVQLTRLIEDYCKSSGLAAVTVPHYSKWIAKMWHFGVDTLDEYDSQEFNVTIQEGLSDLFRIYTKRIRGDNTVRQRLERQEYPNSSIAQAILEKLYPGGVLS